jgi:thiol-disulfide isomerase/thioredoxin
VAAKRERRTFAAKVIPMRTSVVRAVVVCLSLTVGVFRVAAQQEGRALDKSIEPSQLVTLPANVVDVELKRLGGGSFRLSDYSGKPMVLYLWATWCIPCRLETPALVKLQRRFRSRGLVVIALSTENPVDSEEEVRDFARRFSVNHLTGWATSEVAITLLQGRDAIPQAYVISRSRKIVRRFVGFDQVTTPRLLRASIQKALAEDAALTK